MQLDSCVFMKTRVTENSVRKIKLLLLLLLLLLLQDLALYFHTGR